MKGVRCVISDFRREVDEKCALLGYYAASSDNFLPSFRDNLSVPTSVVKNPDLLRWDRQVVPKRQQEVTTTCCVITQMSAVLNNVQWPSRKVHVILVGFQRNLESLDKFSKNTQIWNFMKIRAVGTELFEADKWGCGAKLIVVFRSSEKAPKSWKKCVT